jgi:hypothetical protein
VEIARSVRRQLDMTSTSGRHLVSRCLSEDYVARLSRRSFRFRSDGYRLHYSLPRAQSSTTRGAPTSPPNCRSSPIKLVRLAVHERRSSCEVANGLTLASAMRAPTACWSTTCRNRAQKRARLSVSDQLVRWLRARRTDVGLLCAALFAFTIAFSDRGVEVAQQHGALRVRRPS